jgi:hypothetical protein
MLILILVGILIGWVGVGLLVFVLLILSEVAAAFIRGQDYVLWVQSKAENNHTSTFGTQFRMILLWPIFLLAFIQACTKHQTFLEALTEQSEELKKREEEKRKTFEKPSTLWVSLQGRGLRESFLRIQIDKRGKYIPTHLTAKGDTERWSAVRLSWDKKTGDLVLGELLFESSSFSVVKLACDKDTTWQQTCATSREME